MHKQEQVGKDQVTLEELGLHTYHSANSIASGRGEGMVGVGCVHPAVTAKKKQSQRLNGTEAWLDET